MNNIIVKIIIGALTGFLSSALTDLDAFKKAKDFNILAKYNWTLAVQRWLMGAVSGAMLGLGLESVN